MLVYLCRFNCALKFSRFSSVLLSFFELIISRKILDRCLWRFPSVLTFCISIEILTSLQFGIFANHTWPHSELRKHSVAAKIDMMRLKVSYSSLCASCPICRDLLCLNHFSASSLEIWIKSLLKHLLRSKWFLLFSVLGFGEKHEFYTRITRRVLLNGTLVITSKT